MLYIPNHSHSPARNLAIEEYLLRRDPSDQEEVFLLWRNIPSVIVGRNQNTPSEVHLQAAHQKGIKVVRRLTGGGAVYHDLGTLNYSLILNRSEEKIDLRRYSEPILSALRKMGLNVSFSGRNDLLLETEDGWRKISGTAQCRLGGRLLHHGTILFHTDFESMSAFLTPDEEKFQSHAVHSVKGRVANLFPYLPKECSIEDLSSVILYEVQQVFPGNMVIRPLSEHEDHQVETLRREKYETWEWNIGNSPRADFSVQKRFPWGKVSIVLALAQGKIQDGAITGDFFALNDPQNLINALRGHLFLPEKITPILTDQLLRSVFPQGKAQEFLDLLFGKEKTAEFSDHH